MKNSFIENINYVASLDNRYGKSARLYKNNISLRNVGHNVELKFSYYDNKDKTIHEIIGTYTDAMSADIDSILSLFKTTIESSITGSEFTCSIVTSSVLNILEIEIVITSFDDNIKAYGLDMKVTNSNVTEYNIRGEVNDTLKILPSLALITKSDIDKIVVVGETKDKVVTVSENINSVATVSNNMASVNIVSDGIVNVNTVVSSIANINTVASNAVGLNYIVSNMPEILLADDNAAIATTKASEASISASNSLDSENKAEKWANELEDVAVEPGKYSAMHWANKANSIVNVVNDQVTNTTNTYSSSKVQSMHDAQATAIANLASASATICSSVSQAIPEEPNGFSTLVWDNVIESSNSSIFELGSSSFVFKKNGIYNFFNSLDIYRVGSGATLTITFELYDADTDITVMSAGLPIDMQSGTRQVIPFNVLLEIDDAVTTPKNIKVRMRSTSAKGSIELYTFNSILSLSSVSSTANVDTLDDALGSLITGALI